MDPKYYKSIHFSLFANFGLDLIAYIFIQMPYVSILALGHTCRYMYQVGRQVAPQKALLIQQDASEHILHTLRLEGYLQKLQELRDEIAFVIGGDFILSHITSRPFWTKYIDIYISLVTPYDEVPFMLIVKKIFPSNDGNAMLSFKREDKQKYGHMTIYIWVKDSIQAMPRVLRVHFIKTLSLPDYINHKFDLTCSMLWYDIWSTQIYTDHFYDQVCGIGYVVNDFYLNHTGKRILQFKGDYGFHILNEGNFDWYLFYHQDDMDIDKYYWDRCYDDDDYYSSPDDHYFGNESD